MGTQARIRPHASAPHTRSPERRSQAASTDSRAFQGLCGVVLSNLAVASRVPPEMCATNGCLRTSRFEHPLLRITPAPLEVALGGHEVQHLSRDAKRFGDPGTPHKGHYPSDERDTARTTSDTSVAFPFSPTDAHSRTREVRVGQGRPSCPPVKEGARTATRSAFCRGNCTECQNPCEPPLRCGADRRFCHRVTTPHAASPGAVPRFGLAPGHAPHFRAKRFTGQQHDRPTSAAVQTSGHTYADFDPRA